MKSQGSAASAALGAATAAVRDAAQGPAAPDAGRAELPFPEASVPPFCRSLVSFGLEGALDGLTPGPLDCAYADMLDSLLRVRRYAPVSA